MMAECMVTHGRGLDDFVRAEILDKIPSACNVRHLNEGKIGFRVSSAANNVKSKTPQKQYLRLNDIERDDGCDSSPQKPDNEGTQREENVTQNGVTTDLGIASENESHFDDAACDIFKLRLVERVFILLHCEDVDARTTTQSEGEELDVDSTLTYYEKKFSSLVRSIKWEKLAIRMRRVREHQDREREVLCRDPHCCPGSLRKRQVRKEIAEKRSAFAASRGTLRGDLKSHTTNIIKTNHLQEEQSSKKRKLSDDFELKQHLDLKVCEDKTKGEDNQESDMKESDLISSEYHRTQPKEVCLSEREPNGCQDIRPFSDQKILTYSIPVVNDKSKPERGYFTKGMIITDKYELAAQSEIKPPNKIDFISKNYQSSISSPEHRSEVRRKDGDSENLDEHTKIKKVRRDKENSNRNVSDETPTFRVSSRVSGPFKKHVSLKWISHVLSQQLQTVTSMVPDWRHPLIDLYVNITMSHFIVGVSLSPRPLSLRPYIPHITLRSTISHLMATLSHIPLQATVLDPMCGGGSILLETAMNFDVSHVIASDISQEQLEVARCNLHTLHVPVTLLQADAQGLPLQDSSINTVVCDFPFGLKYKLSDEDKHLLPRVLTETHRLLTCGGRAVFLLSPKQHQTLSNLTMDHTKHSSTTNTATNIGGDRLTLLESHLVSLGETSAYVAVMVKEPYTPP